MSELHEQVIKVMKGIYDPEIPVNIYDLGLIYDFCITDDQHVDVTMTLTTPNCPVADSLVHEVKRRVEDLDGVAGARINLVWEPSWTPEKMTETGRQLLELETGMGFGGPKMYGLNVENGSRHR